MVPELEKPRITEIQVRMDCKGCVKKLMKSLSDIKGVHKIYIDYPKQKITVIGRADLEKIVKAIKKKRKIATIFSHTELTKSEAAPPKENAPESRQSPPPDSANTLPPNAQPAEPAVIPPAEPTKDPPLPPPKNPPAEAEAAPSSSVPTETNDEQSGSSSAGPNKNHVGEVHIIHHHPPDNYGYREYWNGSYDHMYGQGYYSHKPGTQAQPSYVTQSYYYNTYRPKPYVTEYRYHEYLTSPTQRIDYNRFYHYHEDHYNNVNYVNGNIISIFSDENPNACRIM